MFDVNLSIGMLEFVLCSGRDGAQNHGFCLIKSKLRIVLGYHELLHEYFDWMAATIPESIC